MPPACAQTLAQIDSSPCSELPLFRFLAWALRTSPNHRRCHRARARRATTSASAAAAATVHAAATAAPTARVSHLSQRPPTNTSTRGGLCLHSRIAPQLSRCTSATQLYLQASSAQQQYIAVLQSRFVRGRSHWWSSYHSAQFVNSALVCDARLLLSFCSDLLLRAMCLPSFALFCVASSSALPAQIE